MEHKKPRKLRGFFMHQKKETQKKMVILHNYIKIDYAIQKSSFKIKWRGFNGR